MEFPIFTTCLTMKIDKFYYNLPHVTRLFIQNRFNSEFRVCGNVLLRFVCTIRFRLASFLVRRKRTPDVRRRTDAQLLICFCSIVPVTHSDVWYAILCLLEKDIYKDTEEIIGSILTHLLLLVRNYFKPSVCTYN